MARTDFNTRRDVQEYSLFTAHRQKEFTQHWSVDRIVAGGETIRCGSRLVIDMIVFPTQRGCVANVRLITKERQMYYFPAFHLRLGGHPSSIYFRLIHLDGTSTCQAYNQRSKLRENKRIDSCGSGRIAPWILKLGTRRETVPSRVTKWKLDTQLLNTQWMEAWVGPTRRLDKMEDRNISVPSGMI